MGFGLATTQAERFVVDRRTIEVARVRITEAGLLQDEAQLNSAVTRLLAAKQDK